MSLSRDNIEIGAVKREIGDSSYDLGTLCTSPLVNKWSYYKPLSYKKTERLTDTEINNINDGFQFQVFHTIPELNQAISTGDVWRYIKPSGGESSPYRLSDFGGYNHSETEWLTSRINFINNTIQVFPRRNIKDELKRFRYWSSYLPNTIPGEYALTVYLTGKTNGKNYMIGVLDSVDMPKPGDNYRIIQSLDGNINSGDYYAAIGMSQMVSVGLVQVANPLVFFPISDSWVEVKIMTVQEEVAEIWKSVSTSLVSENVTVEKEGGNQYTYSLNSMTIDINNKNEFDVTAVVYGYIRINGVYQEKLSNETNISIKAGQSIRQTFNFTGVSHMTGKYSYEVGTIFKYNNVNARIVKKLFDAPV